MHLLAPVRGWGARRALKAARRRADEEILATQLPSPRLAWRVEELVSAENRVDLGRSVTDVVHAADESRLPNASPVDRTAVRACRAELLDLASALHDLRTTVAPRGILHVERLLVDSAGPLYGHKDPARLRRAVREIRRELDGD